MEGELYTLCVKLQMTATGAHAHTASKAAFYLKQLDGKPKARFSNCTRDAFIGAVRQAVFSDKWKELSDLMSSWW
jgi:hypothetical protein